MNNSDEISKIASALFLQTDESGVVTGLSIKGIILTFSVGLALALTIVAKLKYFYAFRHEIK